MKIEKKIVEEYIKNLRENIRIEKHGQQLIFSLPFYISGGHFLEVTAQQHGKHIIFSDKTRTIGDLFLSGMNIPGRNGAMINRIINRYQLQMNDNYEITTSAKMENAGKILHQLILALVNIGNLEILNTFKMYRPEKIVRTVKRIVESTSVRFKYGPAAIVPGYELPELNFDFVLENGGIHAIQTIDVQRGLDSVAESCAWKLGDARTKNARLQRTVIYNPAMDQWDKFAPILKSRSEAVIPITDEKQISKIITHSD